MKNVRKSAYLKHGAEYSLMQEKLNSIVHEVNSNIVYKNRDHNFVSPFLYWHVHKRNGQKTRYLYSHLIDGVHPTSDLAAAWSVKSFTNHDICKCLDILVLFLWCNRELRGLNFYFGGTICHRMCNFHYVLSYHTSYPSWRITDFLYCRMHITY